MRLILFFDLPVESTAEKRSYRKFVKTLKVNGFYMLQKSVYVKLNIDMKSSDGTIKKIEKDLPPKGNISVLVVTEKQFAAMEFLLGENKTDVVNTDERVTII